MPLKKVIGLLMIFTLFLVACASDKTLIDEQQERLKELEEIVNEKQKIIDEQNKEFSYIHDFTKEELEAYELFAQTKDIQHLPDLTPEKIVLIYYESVVLSDIEAIYALTYDDGTLTDLSTFSDAYNIGNLSKQDQERTIAFRYYDTIEIREENRNENEVEVEINVTFGQFSASNIHGLKKENDCWKMEILHLME